MVKRKHECHMPQNCVSTVVLLERHIRYTCRTNVQMTTDHQMTEVECVFSSNKTIFIGKD